jgi:hypothetical protein
MQKARMEYLFLRACGFILPQSKPGIINHETCKP